MKANNKPLVSIIMNCYNSDTYLKEAIDSVLNQTYQNFEIIFWDNQSNDKSAAIIGSYDDKRIHYFYAPTHTTLGEGRNKALEKVKGDFISFLDCDDWWCKDKIEETLKYFSDKEIGLVHTNGSQFFQDNNQYKKFHSQIQSSGYLFEELISNYNISLVSAMFRKKALNGLDDYFDNRFSMIEEFDFFVRIAKKWKINYCYNQLCYWRAHKESLTWSQKEKVQQEYEHFLEKIVIKFPELENSFCIKRIEAKIAYHQFFNKWNSGKILERKIITKYICIEKKLLIVYIFSFFNIRYYIKFLKLIGKNI